MVDYTHESEMVGYFAIATGQTCADGTFLHLQDTNQTVVAASVSLDDTAVSTRSYPITEILNVPAVSTFFGGCFYIGQRCYVVYAAQDGSEIRPVTMAVVHVEEDATLSVVDRVDLAGTLQGAANFWYDRERSVVRGHIREFTAFSYGNYRHVSIPVTTASIGAPTYVRQDRFLDVPTGARGPAGEHLMASGSVNQYDFVVSADGATITFVIREMESGDALSPDYSGLWNVTGGIYASGGGRSVDPTSFWHSPIGSSVAGGQSLTTLTGDHPVLIELAGDAVAANYIPPLGAPAEWVATSAYLYAGYTDDGFVRTRSGQATQTTVYATIEEAYLGSYAALAPSYPDFLDLLTSYGFDVNDTAGVLAQIGTVNQTYWPIIVESPEGTLYGRSPLDAEQGWRFFLGKSRSGRYLVQDQNLFMHSLAPLEADPEPVIVSALKSTRRRFVRA